MNTVKQSSRPTFVFLLLCCLAIWSLSLQAQVYEKVVSFTDLYEDAPPGGENLGNVVSSMLEGPDGNIYGTTAYETKSLWGYWGGSGPGTIFRMTPDGVLNTLMLFSENPDNPIGPRGTLEVLASDGRFYGLTGDGGAHRQGSIFRITRNGEFSLLRSFTGTQGVAKGTRPTVLFKAPDPNFYGVTEAGGANDAGTVFRMNSLGGITTLVEFTGAAGARPGKSPSRLFLGSDGFLYGITAQGGSQNFGTVFKVSVTGDYELLAEFTGTAGNRPGSHPVSLVEPGNGVIVGSASAGGASDAGVVFRHELGSSWQTVVEFDGPNGQTPVQDLVVDTSGKVFGLTEFGGSFGCGTLFVFGTNQEFSTVHHFVVRGSYGYGNVALKGNLVPLRKGGAAGSVGHGFGSAMSEFGGETFVIDATGNYSARDSFWYSFDTGIGSGFDPVCWMQASDGTIYGSCEMGTWGASPALSTIFQVGGERLVGFGVPRREPVPKASCSGVSENSRGVFFGTSRFGGEDDLGTVYSLTPAGNLSVIHNFTGNATLSHLDEGDGLEPLDGLQVGPDDSLYGCTSYLGLFIDYHIGTAFKMAPNGNILWNSDLSFYRDAQYNDRKRGVPLFLPDGSMIRPGMYAYLQRFGQGGEVSDLGDIFPFISGPLYHENFLLYGCTESGGSYGHGAIFRTHALAGGPVVLADFNDGNLFNLTNSWTNQAVAPRSVTSDPTFEIAFTMKANGSGSDPVDGVVGLSSGPADFYDDLACGIRFFTNSRIEVRNGGTYQDTGIGFSRNRNYRVTLRINLAAKTYSLLVDGVEVATDCAFRPEQAGLATINNFGMISSVGSVTVFDITSAIGLPFQGKRPLARLTKSSAGDFFYGTASEGGVHGHGTVFRMTQEGSLTKLADFTGADGPRKGATPTSALLEHGGWFYGTTNAGGAADLGTVFRISPDGATFESLFDFMDDDLDSVPMGDLTLGSDGNIYGTTHGAGAGRGSVFRLVLPGPPLLYSLPAEMSGNTAVRLQCKINSRGNPAAIWLDYSTDGVNFTPIQVASALGGWRNLIFSTSLSSLIPGTSYVYRFRVEHAGGTINGERGGFDTVGPPVALAANPRDVARNSAVLQGSARAGNASTFLTFEYGTDGYTFPNAVSPNSSLVTGSNEIPVSVSVNHLWPDTTYYYRLRATNSEGISISAMETFTTLADPLATVGGAYALSTTRVRVEGTVNARGWEGVDVAFEYGTGGTVIGQVTATPAVVGGVSDTRVEAVLPTSLDQGTVYFYRVRVMAIALGLDVQSAPATFTMNVLSGFEQDFPDPPSGNQGFIIVNLTPAGVGGWRFTGEQAWRAPGIPVGGLTTSDRMVEFMPVDNYIQPPSEPVTITSGGVPTYLNRSYVYSGQGGSGSLKVTLKPDSLADTNLPPAERAQWRLFKLGVNTEPWLNSDETLLGLLPGNYLIECKPVINPSTDRSADLSTPPPSPVLVEDGYISTKTIVYYLKDPQIGAYPQVLPFETVSTSTNLPYGYVGQIRSDAGSSSGFVVRSRVVVTAGHAIFDEDTLSTVTGLQWLLQRDSASHEPKPLIPRGAHLLDDYAAARKAPAVPGTGTSESQNRDAATLFFGQDAGRGGFSGYLASDAVENEFLMDLPRTDLPRLKMLVGYPVSGEGYVSGRMYATAAVNAGFTRVDALDESGVPFRTYRTLGIRGSGGMSGGPLCVQFENGNYYPAAIYLGGSNETVVRAIDSKVIELIKSAEVSSSAGDDHTGGGITFSSFTTDSSLSGTMGAIKVTIKPAAARTALQWSINSGPWRASGVKEAIQARSSPYTLLLDAVTGFEVPAAQSVSIKSGKVRDITFTYADINDAPTLTGLTNRTINEDGATGAIPFTVNDVDNAASVLDVTGTSSNTTLVPNSNIYLGGSGANRTVSIIPVPNQYGTTTITLRVSDGTRAGIDTFDLTISAVNDAPTISNIADRSAAVNTATAAIPFTIDDVETAEDSLLFIKTSTNHALLPPDNIHIGGSGANRTVTLNPVANRLGSATITLTVSDGALSDSDSFTLTVTGTVLETWRFGHFGTTANTGPAADSADPDGDGQNNLSEYAAGTEPKDADDVFKVLTTTKNATDFSVTADGKSGRIYTLQRRTDLTSGSWGPVSPPATVGPFAVGGQTVTLTDPAPPAGGCFYRILVSMP